MRTITIDRAALERVLEALETNFHYGDNDASIVTIKEALAQPPLPVQPDSYAALREDIAAWSRRRWKMTEKERRLFASWLDSKTDDEVFNAIEAKLKEKNESQ